MFNGDRGEAITEGSTRSKESRHEASCRIEGNREAQSERKAHAWSSIR